jgi:hypothetical protein
MDVLLSLILALLSGGVPGQTRASPLPPLERFHVGVVAVGASAEDVYEDFAPWDRHLVDLGLEGQLSPALEFTFPVANQRRVVVAELGCRSGLVISRIQVRDPAFRTSKGIGVGSTVGELRGAYRLGAVLSGEGHVVIRVEELSASFEVDQQVPGGGEFWRLRTAESIPDSVTIISILLTK